MHGVAIGGGKERDLFEKGVGLGEIAGGDVGGAVEEEVDEEETSVVGFEVLEEWGVGGGHGRRRFGYES